MRTSILTCALVLLLLAGTADAAQDDVTQPPIDAVVLIDESGSVRGAMGAERNAAALIALADLSPRSAFAIAGFGSSNGKGQSAVRQYCDFTALTDAAARDSVAACAARARVRTAREGNDTDHAAALKYAVDLLTSRPEGVTRVIFLLTDGELNVCNSPQYGKTCRARNREAQRELTEVTFPAAREAGIAIWPLGFGGQARKATLERFAQAGETENVNCPGSRESQPRAVVVGDSQKLINELLAQFAPARCAHPESPVGSSDSGRSTSLEVRIPEIATDGAITVAKIDPSLRVHYRDPNGAEAPASGEVDGQSFSLSGTGHAVEALRVVNPLPGTWTVEVEAPPGHSVRGVVATAIWSGALQASIATTPGLPRAGERTTVEIRLLTRSGVVRDPSALEGIAAAATAQGSFGTIDIPLNDAGTAPDKEARDGIFSGPFELPRGVDGCVEIVGEIGGVGVASDQRPYNFCPPNDEDGYARFTADWPETVGPGATLTGTVAFTNASGEQVGRLVLKQLSDPVLTIVPSRVTIAQGGSQYRYELTVAATAPDREITGRLQALDGAGNVIGEQFVNLRIETPPNWLRRFWWTLALAGALVILALAFVLRRRTTHKGAIAVTGLSIRLDHPNGPTTLRALDGAPEFQIRFVDDGESPRVVRPSGAGDTTWTVRRTKAGFRIDGLPGVEGPQAFGDRLVVSEDSTITVEDRRRVATPSPAPSPKRTREDDLL